MKITFHIKCETIQKTFKYLVLYWFRCNDLRTQHLFQSTLQSIQSKMIERCTSGRTQRPTSHGVFYNTPALYSVRARAPELRKSASARSFVPRSCSRNIASSDLCSLCLENSAETNDELSYRFPPRFALMARSLATARLPGKCNVVGN